LDRGYALVTDSRGLAVTSASEIGAGDDITLRMRDGEVAARVSGGAPVKAKKPRAPKKTDDKQGSLL
ncbi:MAG: hypothetical protein KAI28_01025, partial [Sphingomonadales bacterium]|nr:hypothetical protein [Sphingomonadales bacterium]